MNTATNIYEIKVNGKWSKVRATSMLNLDNYCKSIGVKQWRMAGMMSIAELAESKSLTVVA